MKRSLPFGSRYTLKWLYQKSTSCSCNWRLLRIARGELAFRKIVRDDLLRSVREHELAPQRFGRKRHQLVAHLRRHRDHNVVDLLLRNRLRALPSSPPVLPLRSVLICSSLSSLLSGTAGFQRIGVLLVLLYFEAADLALDRRARDPIVRQEAAGPVRPARIICGESDNWPRYRPDSSCAVFRAARASRREEDSQRSFQDEAEDRSTS